MLNQPGARLVGEVDRHIAVGELSLQLHDEFVDDARDDLRRQMAKRHHRVEAVAKLRREQAIDRFAVISVVLRMREADWRSRQIGRAGVGGHDQDDIAEVDRLAVMVRQLAVIHHLQKNIEKIGMRLSISSSSNTQCGC